LPGAGGSGLESQLLRRIRRIAVQRQPGQIVLETLSQKTLRKKGLVEWLKVEALSSSPSAGKKKKKFRLKCTPRLVFFADKVIDLVVWPLSSFSVNHSTFKRSLGALFG
jgi:hypothetical protein